MNSFAEPAFHRRAGNPAPGFLKGDYERRVFRASPAHTESCHGVPATSFGEVAGQKSSALLNMSPMSPRDGAKSGVLALWRKATVVPGFPNKATVFLERLMPCAMQRTVLE